MIVLYVLGYFNRNKQNSYAALSTFVIKKCSEKNATRLNIVIRA